MPRPAPLIVTAAAALLASGCGADRVTVPDVERPFTTGGTAPRAFPAAGVAFQAPADWSFDAGQPPLVASTSSGSATIAIWRYPRTEPLPDDRAALDAAEKALQDAARQREPSLQVRSAKRVRVDGARAVELRGTQRIDGHERQIRSTHVYAKGAEYVIDQYAAPRDFALMDKAVFGPLIASTKIGDPRG